MKEEKENITEFARRMRELAGLSDGSQNKSLKTVQQGESSFDAGHTFYAKDMMTSNEKKESINENFGAGEDYELEDRKAQYEVNPEVEMGFDTIDFRSYTDKDGDKIYDLSNAFKIGPTSIGHFVELAKENDEIYSFLNSELGSNEGVDTGNDIFWGADIIDFLRADKNNDFDVHEINQKEIEMGENDSELYSLNENTIIVLDFLDEGDSE